MKKIIGKIDTVVIFNGTQTNAQVQVLENGALILYVENYELEIKSEDVSFISHAFGRQLMGLREVIDSGAKLTPPSWLRHNLCYETMMGSIAYGVDGDASDMDVYGICIPPKDNIFPHLAGEIYGFGRQIQRFHTWQEHHVEAFAKSWDFQVYGIVSFFQLAMENNPNILDSIYTPRRCVLSSTQVGEYIREHRRDFLHKGVWHKMKGYAYSQMNKIRTKKPSGKRAELVEEFGWDLKFGYHVVRLLLEAEMIMAEGDLDIERHREQLKGIRRGEWTLERLEQWAQDKEKSLETLYIDSKLQYAPDETVIKNHLLHCLEAHYGKLDSVIAVPTDERRLLQQIAELTERFR